MCVDVVFILTQNNVLFFKKIHYVFVFSFIGQLLVKKKQTFEKGFVLFYPGFMSFSNWSAELQTPH